MSVLLIKPGRLDPYGSNFMRHFSLKYPPMSLAVLAAHVKDAHILDLSVSRDPVRALTETLETQSFDFVGIKVVTPFMAEVREIIRIIRKHSRCRIILGGPHVTALPKESLVESGADMVCIGEGEATIREITEGRSLKGINGIGYMENGKFISTRPRGFIDVDKIEPPKWDLIEPKKYFTLFSKRNPTGIIETSRGCPHNCVYCHKQTFGRCYRAKSPKRIVGEMEHAVKSGFREMHVIDDAFSVGKERVLDICREMRKRKLDIPWALPCGLRVDQVDRELFEAIGSAGCHLVAFGVESGSDRILRNIDKGTRKEQIIRAFEMARDSGIETLVALLMVGLPGETFNDINETADLARHLDADITKVSVTIPYPGTRLYDRYRDDNLLMGGSSWASYRMHNPEMIYRHENLSWGDIKKGYGMIMRSVYMNPAHYTRRLGKITGVYFPRILKNYIYGAMNSL